MKKKLQNLSLLLLLATGPGKLMAFVDVTEVKTLEAPQANQSAKTSAASIAYRYSGAKATVDTIAKVTGYDSQAGKPVKNTDNLNLSGNQTYSPDNLEVGQPTGDTANLEQTPQSAKNGWNFSTVRQGIRDAASKYNDSYTNEKGIVYSAKNLGNLPTRALNQGLNLAEATYNAPGKALNTLSGGYISRDFISGTDENGGSLRRAANATGRAVGSAGRAVGSGAMTAGRAVGSGAMTAGRAVGSGAMTAGRAVGSAGVATGRAISSAAGSARGYIRDKAAEANAPLTLEAYDEKGVKSTKTYEYRPNKNLGTLPIRALNKSLDLAQSAYNAPGKALNTLSGGYINKDFISGTDENGGSLRRAANAVGSGAMRAGRAVTGNNTEVIETDLQTSSAAGKGQANIQKEINNQEDQQSLPSSTSTTGASSSQTESQKQVKNQGEQLSSSQAASPGQKNDSTMKQQLNQGSSGGQPGSSNPSFKPVKPPKPKDQSNQASTTGANSSQ